MLLYYIMAGLSLSFVFACYIYDTIKEEMEFHRRLKADYEKIMKPKRGKVLQGMFRQHNENFHRNGFNGPKGTA